ncbi:MAG TPA: ATP-binding cassette domain-containing protein [Usitatibacter sp.]|jgi:tungstate transport system ATP-binding protein|nr:ATP-binding cassette domain-containing protein [Usitatibacter sp.]
MASAHGSLPLEARRVTVRFGALAALDGLDLALDGSAPVAILGANGAGKSVLLRVLHGLLAPSEGEVTWSGGHIRPTDQSMVFQRPVMLRRSALANVEYALAIQGVRGAERRERAAQALARVGLSPIASRPARVLSGGEQQRVALARAWATRPRLAFLDEPTASLDPAAAAEVERVMGEMHAAGTAIVFTTHHLGLARRAATEIVFLDRGRVTERTPAERFFTEPGSPQAAAYLEGELP